MVGLGFSPILAKIVTQIVSGNFVEFDELLSSNIVLTEPEPQLLLDGRLVLTLGPKKLKRRIKDIATWIEAFSTFMLVLSSYFSHRWKDLCQYQLLILFRCVLLSSIQDFSSFVGRILLNRLCILFRRQTYFLHCISCVVFFVFFGTNSVCSRVGLQFN